MKDNWKQILKNAKGLLSKRWNTMGRQTKKLATVIGAIVIVMGVIALIYKSDSKDDHGQRAEDHASHEDHEEGHDEQGSTSDKHEEDIVKLTDKDMKDFGIELASAGPGTLKTFVSVPGEVVFNPEKVVHVSPRYAGIAKRVYKNIGDLVKVGERLAVVESNASLAQITLKSAIQGMVVARHIASGEFVKEDTEVFTIAALDSVWVNLTIYQRNLSNVRKGQKVTLSVGHDIGETQGEIFYVSPIVDERTRTATATVKLDNPEGNWRPGMFVNGKIVIEEVETDVLIPKTALQIVEDRISVFVKTDEGLEPVPVTISRENEYYVEIISGLESGKTYVAKGAFVLKAQLSKGAFGDGHAH